MTPPDASRPSGTPEFFCSGGKPFTQEEARFMSGVLHQINDLAVESWFTPSKLIPAEKLLNALKPWADRM